MEAQNSVNFTPNDLQQQQQLKRLGGEVNEVSVKLNRLMQKQQEIAIKRYSYETPAKKKSVEVEKSTGGAEKIQDEINTLRNTLATLPESSNKQTIRNNIHLLEEKLVILKKSEQFLEDPDFKAIAEAKQELMQECVTIMSSRDSGHNKANAINALLNKFYPSMQSIESEKEENIKQACRSLCDDAIHFAVNALDKCMQQHMPNILTHYFRNDVDNKSQSIENFKNEALRKLSGHEPQKREVITPVTSKAQETEAEIYLQALPTDSSTARFHSSKIFSTIRHLRVTRLARQLEKIGARLLQVESDMEKSMQEVSSGTLDQNLSEVIEKYKNSLAFLKNRLAENAKRLEVRSTSTTQAEALGFKARWEGKIAQLEEELGLLESLSENQFERFVETEQRVYADLEKAVSHPKNVGEYIFKAWQECDSSVGGNHELITQRKEALQNTVATHVQNLLTLNEKEKELQKQILEGKLISEDLHPQLQTLLAKQMTKDLYGPEQDTPNIELDRILVLLEGPDLTNGPLMKLLEDDTFKPIFEKYKMHAGLEEKSKVIRLCNDVMVAMHKLSLPKKPDDQGFLYERADEQFEEMQADVQKEDPFFTIAEKAFKRLSRGNTFMELSEENKTLEGKLIKTNPEVGPQPISNILTTLIVKIMDGKFNDSEHERKAFHEVFSVIAGLTGSQYEEVEIKISDKFLNPFVAAYLEFKGLTTTLKGIRTCIESIGNVGTQEDVNKSEKEAKELLEKVREEGIQGLPDNEMLITTLCDEIEKEITDAANEAHGRVSKPLPRPAQKSTIIKLSPDESKLKERLLKGKGFEGDESVLQSLLMKCLSAASSQEDRDLDRILILFRADEGVGFTQEPLKELLLQDKALADKVTSYTTRTKIQNRKPLLKCVNEVSQALNQLTSKKSILQKMLNQLTSKKSILQKIRIKKSADKPPTARLYQECHSLLEKMRVMVQGSSDVSLYTPLKEQFDQVTRYKHVMKLSEENLGVLTGDEIDAKAASVFMQSEQARSIIDSLKGQLGESLDLQKCNLELSDAPKYAHKAIMQEVLGWNAIEKESNPESLKALMEDTRKKYSYVVPDSAPKELNEMQQAAMAVFALSPQEIEVTKKLDNLIGLPSQLFEKAPQLLTSAFKKLLTKTADPLIMRPMDSSLGKIKQGSIYFSATDHKSGFDGLKTIYDSYAIRVENKPENELLKEALGKTDEIFRICHSNSFILATLGEYGKKLGLSDKELEAVNATYAAEQCFANRVIELFPEDIRVEVSQEAQLDLQVLQKVLEEIEGKNSKELETYFQQCISNEILTKDCADRLKSDKMRLDRQVLQEIKGKNFKELEAYFQQCSRDGTLTQDRADILRKYRTQLFNELSRTQLNEILAVFSEQSFVDLCQHIGSVYLALQGLSYSLKDPGKRAKIESAVRELPKYITQRCGCMASDLVGAMQQIENLLKQFPTGMVELAFKGLLQNTPDPTQRELLKKTYEILQETSKQL